MDWKRPNESYHAHFDCFSGAAGDMMLASCLDVAATDDDTDADRLLQHIIHCIEEGLPELKGDFSIERRRVWKGGMASIAATYVTVHSRYDHAPAPVPSADESDGKIHHHRKSTTKQRDSASAHSHTHSDSQLDHEHSHHHRHAEPSRSHSHRHSSHRDHANSNDDHDRSSEESHSHALDHPDAVSLHSHTHDHAAPERTSFQTNKRTYAANDESTTHSHSLNHQIDEESTQHSATASVENSRPHHEHDHSHDHEQHSSSPAPLRTFSQIRKMLQDAPSQFIPPWVQEMSLAAFTELAKAEAKSHGVHSLDAVHFHEVGAIDSIVDTVGTLLALYSLGVTTFSCSRLPMGEGMVRTDHGWLPVPAPATLFLTRDMPTCPGPPGWTGELVTPTGAALLRVLTRSSATQIGRPPAFTVRLIGIGAGTKDFKEHPNILRLVVGNDLLSASAQTKKR
jgi:uncharacterized protein (DUF111 family)